MRYQFPPEGEPGFITMARGPSTIGFGAGADDDDRYGYWVFVADVDATLGPVLISCRHGHPLDRIHRRSAGGLRAAGVPVVYLGAPV